MTGPRQVVPYGPRAVLAEYDSLDDVIDAAAALRAAAPAHVVDIVPAARTILVTTDGDTAEVARLLMQGGQHHVTAASASPVVIRVRYDGSDLDDVAAWCGLDVEAVVALHSAPVYTVAFCGFMPGFAYLTGLDAQLHLPRRETPRTKVPAGSVAIASEFTAVYPSVSPGGWHLLGTTDAVMWDESRQMPALLPPGATVRFEPE